MSEKTNFSNFVKSNKDQQREILLDYFSKWADIGDSYIYDLTRVKEAFFVGTMSFDDFQEWDEERVTELVDEFLEWLYKEG